MCYVGLKGNTCTGIEMIDEGWGGAVEGGAVIIVVFILKKKK